MKENIGEISIVIPFYNGEKYVETCVASLKKQTYPYFTAYFVDDGSTDRSVQILSGFADGRFMILRQEKRGVSAARNLGMEHSTGDYLAFMDIDDELAPSYLEKLIEAARQSKTDVVLCNYLKRYGNGHVEQVLLPWHNTVIGPEEIQQELIPCMIGAEHRNKEIGGCMWRTFVKRSFWEKTSIRFDEEVTVAEDLLFVLALYNRAERIFVLEDCLYVYYQNVGSAVNQFQYDPEHMEKYMKFYRALRLVLEKENLLTKNFVQYQSREWCGYTVTISNLARNPDFMDFCQKIRCLRKRLLLEKGDYKNNPYVSKNKKVALWMLEHRMYLMLLVLCRMKEWFRMKRCFRP